MNRILYVFFIIVATGILLYLIGIQIYKSTRRSNIYISQIDKHTIYFPKNTAFKYYYLNTPSTTIIDHRPWDATDAKYTINEDGLNERYSYDTFKQKDTIRIITLGDSFTFGHYVDTKDNWTEILEDLLKKNAPCQGISNIEVINLGERGFDIPYSTKKYNDIGLKYHPDVIIWLESGTGFLRYNELMGPYISACENGEASSSSTYIKHVATCWEKSKEMMIQNYSEEYIRSQLHTWINLFLALRDDTPVLFGAFYDLPIGDKRILKERQKNYKNVFFTDKIRSINSQNVSFPDGHPNQKGHSAIANDIYTYLNANKKSLLQCN